MNQSGFSLLEMLLALLLSSFLLMIVGAFFLNCLHESEQDRRLIESQENARIAQKILSDVIMQSGFMGCDNEKKSTGLYIEGNRIFIHKLSSIMIPVTSILASNQILLKSDSPNFQTGDQLMLSDCHTIFYTGVKNIEVTGGVQHIYLEKQMPAHLQKACFVAQLENIEFYLSKSRVSNEGSLYEKNSRGQTQDLLPGVISWSFECFSQHTWKSPELINDWSTVGALKIKLLLKAKEFIFFMPILNYE